MYVYVYVVLQTMYTIHIYDIDSVLFYPVFHP